MYSYSTTVHPNCIVLLHVMISSSFNSSKNSENLYELKLCHESWTSCFWSCSSETYSYTVFIVQFYRCTVCIISALKPACKTGCSTRTADSIKIRHAIAVYIHKYHSVMYFIVDATCCSSLWPLQCMYIIQYACTIHVHTYSMYSTCTYAHIYILHTVAVYSTYVHHVQ